MISTDPYHFLAGVYDELVVDPCHSLWADYITALWADDSVHDVLDLCCGSGLMTDELARRGYAVTGLDASAAMLARARQLLGQRATLHLATLPDLSALPVDQPFDAVVSTLDGLNYLTLPDLRDTLRALAEHVRPGGWLVFDVHADGAIALLRENAELTGTHGDAEYTLHNDVDPLTRRCRSILDYRSTEPGASFVEEHVQFIHAVDDVEAALADAGFRIVSVTDEYTHAPTTPDTVRATWVARRSG